MGETWSAKRALHCSALRFDAFRLKHRSVVFREKQFCRDLHTETFAKVLPPCLRENSNSRDKIASLDRIKSKHPGESRQPA